MRRKQHLNHPALVPLWKSLERDWLLQLTAKLVFFVSGLIVFTIGLSIFPIMLILGAAASIFAGVLLLRHFRVKAPLERLQDRLYDDPDTIVWIYTVIHEHHPFGLQFSERGLIYFKFSNGDEISAFLPPHKLTLITKVLSRALPYTVFGYTKERAAQYEKDPYLVSKWQQ